MTWIVAKAWTSAIPRDGSRHFRLITQGGKGEARWVELQSVLNSSVRIRVQWIELRNQQLWNSGWQQLPNEE